METVIGAEMIHMFDACRAHVDFNNLRHLACTEASLTVKFPKPLRLSQRFQIRSATLMHCHSNIEAFLNGDGSFFKLKGGHEVSDRSFSKRLFKKLCLQDCVKSRAVKSLQWLKGMPEKYAREVVNEVFPKCYNDLEPFGRRFQKPEAELIYATRRNYGYY